MFLRIKFFFFVVVLPGSDVQPSLSDECSRCPKILPVNRRVSSPALWVMMARCCLGQRSQETSRRRYNCFFFNFVKICSDLCIAWAKQAGRKGRWRIQKVLTDTDFPRQNDSRVSAEGIGLPQT